MLKSDIYNTLDYVSGFVDWENLTRELIEDNILLDNISEQAVIMVFKKYNSLI